jgi:hypothetical protein
MLDDLPSLPDWASRPLRIRSQIDLKDKSVIDQTRMLGLPYLVDTQEGMMDTDVRIALAS